MNMRRRSWRVFVSAGIPSMFCLVLRIANPDWMLIVQDDGWMLLNLLFAIPSFILMSPLMLLPFSGVTIHDYPFWMPETLEDRQPEACPRGASGILQLKPRYSERSVAAGSTRSARRIGRSVAAMAVTPSRIAIAVYRRVSTSRQNLRSSPQLLREVPLRLGRKLPRSLTNPTSAVRHDFNLAHLEHESRLFSVP